MKRLFILASAAIIAFASCAKTHVVYNEEPQEIGFRQIANAMTKAAASLDDNTELGVFAYTVTDPNVYFGNTSFEKTDGVWKASPTKYYPIQGKLDFAFYAPYSDGWDWDGLTELSSPTINDITAKDVVYGKYILRTAKSNSALAVDLAHALAKVTINVSTDETSKGHITINSITLTDVGKGGKVTVTYAAPDPEVSNHPYEISNVVWSNITPDYLTYSNSHNLNSTTLVAYASGYIIGSYLPNTTEQTELHINYTMDIDGAGSGSATYTETATFDLSTTEATAYWQMGKHYIYNVKATLTEITFAPEVESFEDVPSTDGKDVVL